MIKRGAIIIILLVLLLVLVDSAWIFSYKRTITSNVIGRGQEAYTITQEFNDLSLDTSTGASSQISLMKVQGLGKDITVNLAIETRRTNLDSTCVNYDDDCNVTVTQIYSNGTRKILSNKQNINEQANFTLFKDTENVLEYKIFCIENSCPQKVNSTVTLTEIK